MAAPEDLGQALEGGPSAAGADLSAPRVDAVAQAPTGMRRHAGRGGIRGPGVLNVISVIAFTLRFP